MCSVFLTDDWQRDLKNMSTSCGARLRSDRLLTFYIRGRMHLRSGLRSSWSRLDSDQGRTRMGFKHGRRSPARTIRRSITLRVSANRTPNEMPRAFNDLRAEFVSDPGDQCAGAGAR